eukprot:TRINITY_DN13254_c0_g1_i1.p1 TRINITY_DN13254_c0_g1~~TRINITY_DN13254_c0_g1_i1.p1  ORF type:complete len:235 (-),score=36.54 TRINITY_DN13254_c0_g1_i1:1-705(-)
MEDAISFFFVLFFLFIVSADVQDPCFGKVGGYQYNLTALYEATGGQQQVVVDGNSNTYFYVPCHKPQQTQCSFEYDLDPAICEEEYQKPTSLFHGLGTLRSTNWTELATGAGKGFHLWFQKHGDSDPPPSRKSDVIFHCVEGSDIGKLEFVSEDPAHEYHFQWYTSYACPIGGDGDGDGDGDGTAVSAVPSFPWLQWGRVAVSFAAVVVLIIFFALDFGNSKSEKTSLLAPSVQ